jgi:hypothetical protein
MSSVVTGDKQLMKIMKRMRHTSARRVMSAGAAEAGKQLAKDVKAEIPSRYKTTRKQMGWRRLKVREAPGGGAKIGARVGRGSKARKDRAGLKGVGMQAQWALLGTGELYRGSGKGTGQTRQTGKRGGPIRRTGSTAAVAPPVHIIAARNRFTLRSKYAEGARKQLGKEIKKGKAF